MAEVETITISPDELIKETQKAGLFRFDGKTIWCPWSQVEWDKQSKVLKLPVWLYEKDSEPVFDGAAELSIEVVSLYRLVSTCDPRLHKLNGKKDKEHRIGILKTIRPLFSVNDERSLYIRRHIADVISAIQSGVSTDA